MRSAISVICAVGVLYACFVLGITPSSAQQLRLMEWNVENLFHPSDDSLTLDDEFTPEGECHWTFGRFHRKLSSIAQVIACTCDIVTDEARFPDLIALCEVESDSTMTAMTRRSTMKTLGYRYLCTHGSDRRGMNVALLYDPFVFTPLSWREVVVPSVEQGYSPTRNLLYVCGQCMPRRDTLHIIVAHLPSQASGTKQSDSNRQLAAEMLISVADSVLAINPNAAMVVTGDMNSVPQSKVIKYLTSGALRSLSFDYEGTYRFQGTWDYLDYVLCSPAVQADTAHVVHFPFMMEENKTHGGEQPYRTYRGKFYHGGISDHLPLIVNLSIN